MTTDVLEYLCGTHLHTYVFVFVHTCVVQTSHPGYPQVVFVQMPDGRGPALVGKGRWC